MKNKQDGRMQMISLQNNIRPMHVWILQNNMKQTLIISVQKQNEPTHVGSLQNKMRTTLIGC